MNKRRPATEWLKWYKKIVLFIFYSLAEMVIIAIESIERLLGGDVSVIKKEYGRREGDTIRVVADKEIDYQKALPPLVELSRRRQRQRMGHDGHPLAQDISNPRLHCRTFS